MHRTAISLTRKVRQGRSDWVGRQLFNIVQRDEQTHVSHLRHLSRSFLYESKACKIRLRVDQVDEIYTQSSRVETESSIKTNRIVYIGTRHSTFIPSRVIQVFNRPGDAALIYYDRKRVNS